MLYILLGDDLLQIDLEDLLPSFHCRPVDIDVSVKTTGTHEGLVEYVGTIGASKNNNLLTGVEAIHFGQDLVQCRLTLVVATKPAAGVLSGTADSVDLINEDNARGV